MNLAELSIKRPVFITCLVLLSLAAGLMSIKRLGVDLFPDVTFPVVMVSTTYPGAGPSEIESLVSKPLEDEISTLAGIKRLSSINAEGVSQVVAEFTLETDVKYAEQQIRDRVGATKRKLPRDIKEPIIRRLDPADMPIVILALKSDMGEAELHDLAEESIKPRLEQVNQVGLVEVLGGRKREIQVALDRRKLNGFEISAGQVADRVTGAGEDVPSGKKSEGEKETIFRTVGQFQKLDDIKNLVINFFGNERPVRVADLGHVVDTLEDERSQTFLNEEKSLFLYVFKQSGANTIAVVDALMKRVGQINGDMERRKQDASLAVVRDGSKWIRNNVTDVEESILFGAFLAVIVVYLFLANGRSTIITGLALPNSLIGAFILIAVAGFTINIMSLLALSLSVGLLIDDAIVVRENIFRHIEMGKKPTLAALIGTREVTLAVIATTFTVIAVFGPLGFLKGVTGQFFKQFGLTVCFAMAISLFDALTVAPMLSAYFAGVSHKGGRKPFILYRLTLGPILAGFGRFQNWLDGFYERVLKLVLRRPITTLFLSVMVFFACVFLGKFVTKTFLPTQDAGEFNVSLDLPPGTNLHQMAKVALEVSEKLKSDSAIADRALTVGSREGDANVANIYVRLIPFKQRPGMSTSAVKERVREMLKPYAYANPAVKDYDAVGGGQRPFIMNIYGNDQEELEKISLEAFAKLKALKGLKDPDVNFRPGKPEFRIVPRADRAQMLGVSTAAVGRELRAQVEGVEAAKFRQAGIEYNIRVRMQEDQRDLPEEFNRILVPNLNNTLVRLPDVAEPVNTVGPSKITRQDRNRFIQINADIAPGAGLGNLMDEITRIMVTDLKVPETRFSFIGQAENFKELGESMAFAMGAGILFIYLVLASLYESFVVPFTIMLALPLAIAGSFVALFLGGESLNIFSMIGIVMLLGVATKNSILLVDYANRRVAEGLDLATAMLEAGRTRLRPIMMTTMALIAGTIPIALGLNEASKQRTSMGVAIIGGLISSTILSLVVVPAAYMFLERFRAWSRKRLAAIFTVSHGHDDSTVTGKSEIS
jgi:hydrophobic/amphiphilic exporter-1 (mainly G- bacteria), HAE1 family